jgi:arsenite-transporting ATPase
LTFWLPTARKQDLDVHRKETELFVSAGNYTRVFSLPDSLADREIAGARFADGALTVSFR